MRAICIRKRLLAARHAGCHLFEAVEVKMNLKSAVLILCGFASLAVFAEPLEAMPDRIVSVLPAGDRVIISDPKGVMWIRDAKSAPESQWSPLKLPSPTATIRRALCALDGSGDCALLIDDKKTTTLGFLRANALEVSATGQAASNLVGMLAPNQISFTTADATGKRSVFVYDLETGHASAIGAIGQSETGLITNVNGRTQILAISEGRNARLLSEEKRRPLRNLDFPIFTRFGSLYAEKWYSQAPYKMGFSTFGIGQWLINGDTLSPEFFNVSTANNTEFSAIPVSFTASANGDIFAVYTGKAGKRIGYLCSENNAATPIYNFGVIGTVASDESVSLVATGASSGVYATFSSPHYGQRLVHLDLGSRTLESIADRRCNGPTANVTALFHAQQPLPPGWTSTQRTIKTQKGTVLKASILSPSDGPVKNVIVDVYGAYGQLRTFIRPADSVLAAMESSGTALIVATVRGDGDLGYEVAMASRTPNRHRAVEDVVAIGEYARNSFLGAGGKVTVRGHSGGGWLAFRAALERPDLFAGAIGYAGAYIFGDDPKIASGEFFGPGDSLDRLFPTEMLAKQCTGQRYMFIHAKDDPVASFAQATRFRAMMTAAGCKTDMVALEKGGHNLIDASISDVLQWGGSGVLDYYTPL